MRIPQVYFVDGTAVAHKGFYVFKGVMAGYGSDTSKLQRVADIIQLRADNDGLYYLQSEGCGEDCGDKYLIASNGIACTGSAGQDGTISCILSPRLIYDNYREGVEGIIELLNIDLDGTRSTNTLLRLLFIGVCGELEGYLYSIIISLVQGSKDAFSAIRLCNGLPKPCVDIQKDKSDVIRTINDKFHFQHIHNRDAKERKIYER